MITQAREQHLSDIAYFLTKPCASIFNVNNLGFFVVYRLIPNLISSGMNVC